MATKQKIILLSVLLASVVIFVGCSKDKSSTSPTLKLNTSLPANIQVTIPPAAGIMATNNSYTFSGSISIDPTNDSLIAKYKNYIKSWEVDSIQATFINISTPDTLTNVSLQIKTDTETFGWQSSSISINDGTKLVLGNDEGQLDKLSQVLYGMQPFTVTLSGTSDKADVQFTLSMKISTSLVINSSGS